MDPKAERMLRDKIGSLQRVIETFVKDIGFDFGKFYNTTFAESPVTIGPKSRDDKLIGQDKAIQGLIRDSYRKANVPGRALHDPFNDLPTSRHRLDLYEALRSRGSEVSEGSDNTQQEGSDNVEPEGEKTADNEKKTDLELIKLERDKKRRRKKFKAKAGKYTLMDKHRELVNDILESWSNTLMEQNLAHEPDTRTPTSVEVEAKKRKLEKVEDSYNLLECD